MKTIVLISGKLRSGKNTMSQILIDKLVNSGKKITEDMFAKDLKDNCKNDFKLVAEVLNDIYLDLDAILDRCVDNGLEDCIVEDMRDEIDKLKTMDDNFYEDKTPITRALLQTYGTEIFRNRVSDTYWVDQVIERCRKSNSDYIFITDVRFPNEISRLEEQLDCNIIKMRIERPMDRESLDNEHPSEKGLDNYTNWDNKVENDKGLDELERKIDNIITQHFY